MFLPTASAANSPIRLGFVPLVEGAPIAVAQECGIFERHGLQVRLSRELGWASIRNKLVHGQLDAAQSIAGIPITLGLGLGTMRCDLAVPLVLNLQGSAITLSSEFSRELVGKGEGLRDFIHYRWKKSRPFLLAVSHRHSTQYALLCIWLEQIGVAFPGDIEIVTVPAFLMPRHLKAGLIDGYCSGEPWNSEAVLAGSGWCPAKSADLASYHPENLLVVRGEFLKERKDQMLSLVAALIEACELCQLPEFRPQLIAILARAEYIGAEPEVLANCLGSDFDSGAGRSNANGFHVFHGGSTNRPDSDKASWALSALLKSGAIGKETCGALSTIYREDLYSEAELRVPRNPRSSESIPMGESRWDMLSGNARGRQMKTSKAGS